MHSETLVRGNFLPGSTPDMPGELVPRSVVRERVQMSSATSRFRIQRAKQCISDSRVLIRRATARTRVFMSTYGD
jgi:hypothetical protein